MSRIHWEGAPLMVAASVLGFFILWLVGVTVLALLGVLGS